MGRRVWGDLAYMVDTTGGMGYTSKPSRGVWRVRERAEERKQMQKKHTLYL